MARVIAFGAVNWDTTMFVERFPRPGEEVSVTELQSVPGGTAGNVAVAASRILGKDNVGVIGAVGSDEIGARHFELFDEEGVLTEGLQVNSETFSGQAFITVDSSGENTVQTYFGSNHAVDARAASAYASSVTGSETVLVVTDPPYTAALEVMKAVRGKGGKVVWDPGVLLAEAARTETGKGTPGLVDWLVLNSVELDELESRYEGRWLSGSTSANPGLKLAVKMGSSGCALVVNGSKTAAEPVDLRAHGFSVANTVGCGDAFLGALAASLSMGSSDREALSDANLAGAFKATRKETRGSGTLAELVEFAERVGKPTPFQARRRGR